MMKVGRIVFGVLGVLVGVAALSSSLQVLLADRDADDFFVSNEQDFARSSFAVVSEDVDVLTDAPGWLTTTIFWPRGFSNSPAHTRVT